MNEELVSATVSIISEGFDNFLRDFREITGRAKIRYQNRDWHGLQADSRRRLNLYKRQVYRIARQVQLTMGDHFNNLETWREIKPVYARQALQKPEYEIAETFLNSVCRKVLGDIGANIDMMFVADEHTQREYQHVESVYYSYHREDNRTVADLVRQVLKKFEFDIPYEDLERDVLYITEKVQEDILYLYQPDEESRLDIVKSVFYRNKGAYIVGRFFIGGKYFPFIIPLLHSKDGIYADTLITDPNDMSIIFSYTRSYFLVNVDIPSELVHFIKTVLPLKPYSDIYNSIGFNKHGKTELYRHFLLHLDKSNDQFIIAPGIRGMVMAVFTLPSYHIVFKLIKDKFDPPKSMSRGQVKSKYKLVSMHDRVGRMADTHEFEYFSLPKDRFSEELLEHLLQVAGSIVRVEGENVIIDHLYTERKMVPLNLYLDQANEEEIEAAVEEYGNCIKQLAAANIFPGDMLLKNFGVTRHNRVVFYDYDEIGLLTDYRFRRLPEPEESDEVYASTPWFAVSHNDVFPEEFKYFLIGKENIREVFYQLHGDLFEPKFWIDMQQKQIDGEIVDVFPYRRKKRFLNRVNN
ncbi:MAG: bifunctional isocitrate dehydrogenase kinase/phosphatase [Bacteroidetes bacterium]|nr:bifunctional isocitrate dehydrogenase kinase/phosphatase [Bacteroidota bacterium]MCB0841957.1 bifunctional isocitrate dehydrogenase kinase/phosphatase [Bacteroidota bacterium]